MAEESRLAELMVAYQGGDMAAFEALWETLADELLGFLRSLVRDPHKAEDLLQETFLQLHKARATYLPGKPVRPWVYAIARNVFLMAYRAAKRRQAHEDLAAGELPEVPILPEMEASDGRKDLAAFLACLPELSRQVLLLHHVAGLSFREVGAVLGLSEGAAKVRAHRALEQLRRLAQGRNP
jgi:RNA polymerase sigma-70 factor (ECF subfamily)